MAIVRNGAGLLALALLLTGCTVHVEAGTGSPGARPKTSTVPNVPSAIVVSKSGAPGDFTVARMQAALLDQNDLAPGWTVGTSTINTPDPPATGCPPLDELNHWPATKVIIGFIAGDGSRQRKRRRLEIGECDFRQIRQVQFAILGEKTLRLS